MVTWLIRLGWVAVMAILCGFAPAIFPGGGFAYLLAVILVLVIAKFTVLGDCMLAKKDAHHFWCALATAGAFVGLLMVYQTSKGLTGQTVTVVVTRLWKGLIEKITPDSFRCDLATTSAKAGTIKYEEGRVVPPANSFVGRKEFDLSSTGWTGLIRIHSNNVVGFSMVDPTARLQFRVNQHEEFSFPAQNEPGYAEEVAKINLQGILRTLEFKLPSDSKVPSAVLEMNFTLKSGQQVP